MLTATTARPAPTATTASPAPTATTARTKEGTVFFEYLFYDMLHFNKQTTDNKKLQGQGVTAHESYPHAGLGVY